MIKLVCWIFKHDVEVSFKEGHLDEIRCLRCKEKLQEGQKL